MADNKDSAATPHVQPPGTGVTSTDPDRAHTGGAEAGRTARDDSPGAFGRLGDAPAPVQEIRPITLPSGVHVISGPLPAAGGKSGAGNVAGTPGFGFTFHGQAGGAFRIEGAGFNQYGSVYVGGKQVTVTAWDQNRIKGLLPADVDVTAEVMVVDGTGTVQRGPATAQGVAGQVQLTHEVSREELEQLRRGQQIKAEGDRAKGPAPDKTTEAPTKPGDAGTAGKK